MRRRRKVFTNSLPLRRTTPMAASSIRREILQRAVTLMGAEELARSLEVPVPLVHEWECGDCLMPDMIFLDLVDLLDGRTATQWNRPKRSTSASLGPTRIPPKRGP